MASNRFRERMDSGAPLTGTHVMTAHEDLIEVAAATGLYDTIEFSAEYSMFDMRLLNNMARAAELHNTSLIIKLDQYSQGFWAQAAIGAGFHAVLFTDIRTPDDIVACHKILRPDKPGIDGHMGVKIRRIAIEGYSGSKSYLQKIEDIGFMIMIEKDVAVQNLDEICSVASDLGVDMIQWGPSDFGFSRPSTPTPEEVQYFEKQVIKTALAKGIRPRVELEFPTPEKMDYYTELGIKDYCAMWDRNALSSGWTKTGTALKDELAARWSQYY